MSILLIILAWRIGLFIVAFFTHRYLEFTPTFPYSDIYLFPSNLPNWIWSFANFDGVHYLGIAKDGYFAQYSQAFFPIYPLMMGVLAVIKNNAILILSGLLISLVSFYLAVKMLWKLLSLDYPRNQVKQIIYFLLIFPTSFFFASLYTESIFILLIISSFYFARKKRWVISGLLGMFASATRITGILLLPALLWEQIDNNIKNQILNIKNTGKKSNIIRYLEIIKLLFYQLIKSPITYLVPVGLLSYMVYLQIEFKDALYFWHAQPAFGAERGAGGLVTPMQVLWRYVKILTSVSISGPHFWPALWELSSFILAIVLLIIAHKKKVRFSYLVFSWLAILLPTLSGTLSSMPRYILMAFPIFITLGTIESEKLRYLLQGIVAVLLIYFSTLFLRGLWVA